MMLNRCYLKEGNGIHFKSETTINVVMTVKNIIYVKDNIFGILLQIISKMGNI